MGLQGGLQGIFSIFFDTVITAKKCPCRKKKTSCPGGRNSHAFAPADTRAGTSRTGFEDMEFGRHLLPHIHPHMKIPNSWEARRKPSRQAVWVAGGGQHPRMARTCGDLRGSRVGTQAGRGG